MLALIFTMTRWLSRLGPFSERFPQSWPDMISDMPPDEPSISLSQGPFHPAIVNPASLTESQLECSDTRHEVVTGRVQTSSQSIVSNRGRIRWNKVTSFGGLPKLSTQKLGSSIPQIAKVCGSLKMFDTLTLWHMSYNVHSTDSYHIFYTTPWRWGAAKTSCGHVLRNAHS